MVAFTDFSQEGEYALLRAASLASENGWSLQIVYAPLTDDALESGPIARLGLTARQIARRFNIPVEASNEIVDSELKLVSCIDGAHLIVMASTFQTWSRRFWCNTPIDKVLRNSRCPLLVVKTAYEAPYKRMLVGVDFNGGATALVNVSCEVIPNAELHLFHAISRRDETRLRATDASIDAIQAFRRQIIDKANGRLFNFADSLTTRRNRVMYFVGYGDTAEQASVQQQAVNAGVIVVGKRQQGAFKEMLLGNTAKRILRISESDVLVIPQTDEAAWSLANFKSDIRHASSDEGLIH